MPPLPLQLRLEEYQVVAIDAVREVRNHDSGLSARLSRQQVISAIIDQWIAAHAEAPVVPPGARVVVPPPGDDAVRVLAAEVAAAPPETLTTPPTAPAEAPRERLTTSHAVASGLSPQAEQVLAVLPTLEACPEGMSRREIRAASGLTEVQTDNGLGRLRRAGKARAMTKGQYVRV